MGPSLNILNGISLFSPPMAAVCFLEHMSLTGLKSVSGVSVGLFILFLLISHVILLLCVPGYFYLYARLYIFKMFFRNVNLGCC